MRKASFLFCAIAASEASFAGGFALIEQGASGLGNSYAGAAAVSQDASTVWFNPAGMSELKERELLVAGHVIGVSSEFTDRGTTLNPAFLPNFGQQYVDPDFATAEAVGANGTTGLPNLYYVHPLKQGVTLGIGLSVPFGNSSDYDRDWVGRYQAIESAVAALDINPSISYRVNDNLNIGGGLSIQTMSAQLGSAVDSGGTCFGLSASPLIDSLDCLNAGLSGPGVAATDGYADIGGDGAAVSFNLGLLYKPRQGTKLGVAYRHGVDHELDGTADFTNHPGFEALLASLPLPLEGSPTVIPQFLDQGVTAKASLPPTLMFSAAHKVNDQLELLADATFTGWSSFQELRIVFDQPESQPDTFNTLKFEDVWRVSGGLNYKYSDQLTLRAGVAYDEDPVPSPTFRTARIPGNERVWASVGMGYKFNSRVSMDAGFAHLMIDDTPVDNASEAPGGTHLRGVFETSANIISAQVTVQFN